MKKVQFKDYDESFLKMLKTFTNNAINTFHESKNNSVNKKDS